MLGAMDRPSQDCSARQDRPAFSVAGISVGDLRLLWRLFCRIAMQQPRVAPLFIRLIYDCAKHNPRVLEFACMHAAMFLHLWPFSKFVISYIDKQIAVIDSGEWQSPPYEDAPLKRLTA